MLVPCHYVCLGEIEFTRRRHPCRPHVFRPHQGLAGAPDVYKACWVALEALRRGLASPAAKASLAHSCMRVHSCHLLKSRTRSAECQADPDPNRAIPRGRYVVLWAERSPSHYAQAGSCSGRAAGRRLQVRPRPLRGFTSTLRIRVERGLSLSPGLALEDARPFCHFASREDEELSSCGGAVNRRSRLGRPEPEPIRVPAEMFFASTWPAVPRQPVRRHSHEEPLWRPPGRAAKRPGCAWLP